MAMTGDRAQQKSVGRELLAQAAWVAVVLVVALATFLQPGEDSYISFRYSEQLVAGHGLVYNEGERVEGYSNLLWVLLMAVFKVVGAPLGPSAQVVSTVSLAALVLLARSAGRSLMPGAPWLVRSWLALALAFEPLLHYHDDRGLETVPYAAVFAAALLLGAMGFGPLICGAIAAVGVLLRPEGIAFAAAAGCLFLAAPGRIPDRLRRLAIYLSIPIACFAIQLLFRQFYYGEWVPNTMIAKRSGGPGGGMHLVAYVLTRAGFPLLALLGIGLALRDRRWGGLALGSLAIITAAALFQLRAGGLLNEGFRYLAPLFPVSAVGVWLLLTQLRERDWLPDSASSALSPVLVLWGATLLFAAPATGGAWLLRGNGNAPASRLLPRLAESSSWNIPERVEVFFSDPVFINADAGRWVDANLPPKALLAADQMGQFGYYTGIDRPIVDLLGLMDAHVARHGLSAEYLLRRDPDYIVVETCLPTRYWPAAVRLRPHVPMLRDLLADPRIRSVYKPRWLLKPRYHGAQLGFMVYQSIRLEDGEPLEIIEVGATHEETNRVWRVFPKSPIKEQSP